MQTYVYLLKPRLLRLYALWVSLLVGVPTLLMAAPGGGRPAAPPTPGNYVFRDNNQNGIYDATDTGIQSLTVSLYRSDGVFVENAVTTSTGQFVFTNGALQPSTSYDIRIRPTAGNNALLGTLKLTQKDAGTAANDNEDSDASMVGSTAVIVATTNGSGAFANDLGFGYQAGDADLILTKAASTSNVTKGQNGTFTIIVNNNGGSTAAGVTVRDTLDAGMGYVSSTPTATTTTLGDGRVQLTWGGASTSLAAGANLTYSVTVRAVSDGVLTNVAAVTATTPDATPRNNIARACFTVPVKLCQGESYIASLSATGQTNIEWFRDGVSVGTGPNLTITLSGTYSYTANGGGSDCGTSSCCPLVIYDGSVTPPTLAASTTAICVGQSASLTATNCAGTLAWSTGATTPSITVAPIVTTTYSVTCTPTSESACPASSSIVITVNPSVTATVASATICDGTSATLTANASGGSGFTYSWAPGAAISGSTTGSAITANPTATTTYTVTVTNDTGCSTTATATVTVNPAVTAVAASQTICDGTTATLAVTATGGSGFSYAWTPIGTITGGQSTSAITVNPTATTTYSVVVTNSDGCSTTTTATVTVNPAVTATVASATICDGNSATLVANATGGSGFTYNWSPAVTSGQGTSAVTVNPTVTTTYTVTATNSDGCSTTATATVTVNPAVTATVANQTICNGTSATLAANATGGSGFSYEWAPAGTITAGQNTSAITVNPTATTTYSVTVTNSNGCFTSTTATVTVNPAVTAVIAVSPSSTICEGNSVTLTASNGGSAGATYLWSNNATTASITVAPTTTTAYSVTVSNANGCEGTTSTTITVNPTPVLTVNSLTICQDQDATLTVSGCTGTLTWNTGTTGANLTVSPLQTTVYSATCVLSTGCSATTSTTVTVTPAPSVQRENVTVTRATCNGGTPNADASIALTNLQNVASIAISTPNGNDTTLGSQTNVTGNTFTFNNLPNPTSGPATYLIRLYSTTGCFSDVTVTLDPAECVCPAPKCVPIVIRKVQ